MGIEGGIKRGFRPHFPSPHPLWWGEPKSVQGYGPRSEDIQPPREGERRQVEGDRKFSLVETRPVDALCRSQRAAQGGQEGEGILGAHSGRRPRRCGGRTPSTNARMSRKGVLQARREAHNGLSGSPFLEAYPRARRGGKRAAWHVPRQRSLSLWIGRGEASVFWRVRGCVRVGRYSGCGAPSPRRRRRNHSGGRTGRPSLLAQACWVMPSARRVLRSASVTLYTKVSEARPTSAIPART